MCAKEIRIGNKDIGEGKSLYFIADIAANHDGDLKRALRLIELAKEAGADAAKFQNFQAEKIVSKKGFESLGRQLSHQASWKKPVFEVYKDASISFDWAEKLKKKCDEVDIEYLTSPYDFESVDAVDKYLNAYKIGSGDITWIEIIEYIAKKNKPVILATGASTMEDVKRAMVALSKITSDIVLMQCNTNYTASVDNFKHINLNVLNTYRKVFPGVILGLSDHTLGYSTVLGAISLGARVFEKHFTDDTSRIGPDHRFSMTPSGWREMVARANEVYNALGDGIKRIEDNEKDAAIVQRRGIRYTRDLKKGDILREEDIFPLRPKMEDGVFAYEKQVFIGKKLNRDVCADDHLIEEDFKKC